MITRATPERARMLGELADKNRLLRPLFVVWPLLSLLALAVTRWEVLLDRPVYAAIGLFLSGYPTYIAAFQATFRSARWVADIAPDKRLGGYTRDDLLALVADVHRRLGVQGSHPTAITPDKELNASVMMLGMAGLFPKLNAVYLHRTILHVLGPGELASVIGHELGHYHRHRVEFGVATAHHLALLGCVSLALTSWIPEPYFAMGGIALASWVHSYVLGSLRAPHARHIEYLCDEAGAEAAGVRAAINCELKLGLEAEASLTLQDELLRKGRDIPIPVLLALYEEALPFGSVDQPELKSKIEASLAHERRARGNTSLRGFVNYLRENNDAGPGEAPPSLLPDGQLLAWDRASLRAKGALDDAQIAELMSLLEAHPEALLFRLPEEAGDPRFTSHPAYSRRVLHLWRNRGVIGGGELPSP